MTGLTSNLHPDLTAILVELEDRMGFPLQVVSGQRTESHNIDVGGVPGSEHTYDPAEGADVFCQRSGTRYRMLKALFDMGVKRIGIGNTFIHVGIATDKPEFVAWDYYPETVVKHDGPRTV